MRLSLPRPGLVVLALGLIVSALLVRGDPFPLLFPDSPSYINWEVARSAGYPVFLRIVGWLDPSLAIVRWVQPLLLVVATAGLSEVIAVTLGRPRLGLFVGALTLANLPLLRFSLGVLAEALFTTLLVAHLAAFLLLVARPSPRRWLLLALTAAAAVLVRPAGLSLLAGVGSALLLPGLRRTGFFRSFAFPLAAVWLLAASVSFQRFGVFALQEFGGISLVGHVAFLVDDQTVSRYPGLGPHLARDVKPWREAAPGLDWPREHYWFTTSEWNPMVHRAVQSLDAYRLSHSGDIRGLAGLPRNAALNRLGADVAKAAVRRHPFEYLRHVAAHLYGMWVLPQWVSAAEMVRIRGSLASGNDHVPDQTANMLVFVSQRSALFLAVKSVLMFSLLLATLAGLAVPWRSRYASREDAAWAFCSVNVHAAFALVASLQAASWRFSIVWWPYGLLALGIGAERVLSGLAGRGLFGRRYRGAFRSSAGAP